MEPLDKNNVPLSNNEKRYLEISKATFQLYDSIFYVNIKDNHFVSYIPSASADSLTEKLKGDDFFKQSEIIINSVVIPDDKDYVLNFIKKENLLPSLQTKQSAFISYRQIYQGKEVYYRIKAIRSLENKDYIIIVFENINEGMDEELEYRDRLKQYNDFINGLATEYDILYSLDLKTDEYNYYNVSDELSDIKEMLEKKPVWFEGYSEFVRTSVAPQFQKQMMTYAEKKNLVRSVKDVKRYVIRFQRVIHQKQVWMEMVIIKNENAAEEPERLAVGFRNINDQVLNEVNQSMLLAAVRNHFTIAIAKNITNNSYRMIEHGNFVNGKVGESGTYDELLQAEAETVPEGEQRERFLNKFQREHVIEAIRRKEKSIYLRHQQYDDIGKVHWIDTTIIPITYEEPYLAISLSGSADENQKQIEDLQEALRKESVYYQALKTNMCATMEVNLSTGRITDGPFEIGKDFQLKPILLENIDSALFYDAFEQEWADVYLLSDKSSFLNRCNCDYLLSRFHEGYSYLEVDCKANWFDGSVRNIRESYYISQKESSKDVIALCILYDFTESIKQMEKINALTSELEDTRIKVSTGQMKPHFLYNALASIREIILDDPQYASDLIYDFTTHLRACVKSMSSDALVPFTQELENIKAYVNIEKMRFGKKLVMQYEIDNTDFLVLPLSIQPLVENAIRHGIYPLGSKGGTVTVRTFKENGQNVIQVNDNGVGFDYKKVEEEIETGERDSTGLRNLIFRLEKVLDAKVMIESHPGLGTTVSISIPNR